MKYDFYFRTAFTKERKLFIADNLDDALRLYDEYRKTRNKPLYLDYVWKIDEHGNYTMVWE